MPDNSQVQQAQQWYQQNPNSDPVNILKLLLAPQAPSPDSAQGALGPATVKQLGNVGADTAQATGPYQEGVAKALKALGQQHATEAVQAGMSPQAIQQHELMQQPQQQSDPMSALSQLVGSQSQPQQQQASSTQSTQGQSMSPIQQQAMNTIHPTSILGKLLTMFPGGQAYQQRELDNLSKAQSVTGQEPMQQKEAQENLLPMTEYERAQNNVQKATMLLNYGGKVSDSFQTSVQPHVDAINDALSANNLYQNVKSNPGDQQAAQAFLEASAKLQGVKDPKELMQGRGALAAGAGAAKELFGKSGFSEQEMARIQKANIAQYQAHQKALESLTQQHQNRLKKVGLDPDQFINQQPQPGQGQYTKTGTLPDGRRVGMKQDGTSEIING